MTDGLPVRRYSTDPWLPRERHEAWVHRHWPSFGSAVVATPVGDFSAHSEEITLDCATVFYGAYSAQSLHRTSRLIRADGFDHLGICIALDGTMGGDEYSVSRGGMLLTDLSIELMHHAGAARTITIALPRTLATDAGIDPRAQHGRVVAAADAAMLRSHLLQIRRSAAQHARSDAPRLLRTIVDLLAVTVSRADRARHGELSVSPAGDETLKVYDLIERYIGEPDLSAAFICRRLSLSRSALYRLFEETGGVQAHIRNRRLDLARAALLDVAGEMSIRDIAERFGFDDPAHFSRAFRRRFDIAPRDLRAAERQLGR